MDLESSLVSLVEDEEFATFFLQRRSADNALPATDHVGVSEDSPDVCGSTSVDVSFAPVAPFSCAMFRFHTHDFFCLSWLPLFLQVASTSPSLHSDARSVASYDDPEKYAVARKQARARAAAVTRARRSKQAKLQDEEHAKQRRVRDRQAAVAKKARRYRDSSIRHDSGDNDGDCRDSTNGDASHVSQRHQASSANL